MNSLKLLLYELLSTYIINMGCGNETRLPHTNVWLILLSVSHIINVKFFFFIHKREIQLTLSDFLTITRLKKILWTCNYDMLLSCRIHFHFTRALPLFIHHTLLTFVKHQRERNVHDVW